MRDRLQSSPTGTEARATSARPISTAADSWFDTSPMNHMRNMLALVRQSQDQRQRVATDRARIDELEQENVKLRERLETVSHREANARYLATHDGLTGLASRSLLMDRYIQAAAHAQRNNRPIALLVFDLNGFKPINDEHGHLVGDRVLQRIGHVLEETARAGDTACRYGGDEFVLLLASVDGIDAARIVADKVHARIADGLRVEDIHADVTASCGIAMYPEDGNNWHALMEAADIAMYRDKPRRNGGAVDGASSAPRRPMRSHARYDHDAARVAMMAAPVIAANGGPKADTDRSA